MKKFAAVAGLVLPIALASAQSITITHSTDPTFVVPGSVACASTAAPQRTADNGYFRSYDLSTFVASGNDVMIDSIDFGVENAVHPLGQQDITINIYTDPAPASPINFAGLVLVGTETVTIIDEAEVIELVNLSTPIQVCGTDTLVVEIFSPDYIAGQTENTVFFMGSNAFGQTAPSFLRSLGCAITDPTDLVAIGFPDMHIVTSVFGTEVPSTVCGGAPCYADCDMSGTLNILDYICFGDDFAAGGTYADCDMSGSLNILDYICFGDAFALGCP